MFTVVVGVVQVHGSGWCSACLDMYLFTEVAFGLVNI